MYDLGATVTLTADCRDADGDLANATTAALTITLPDGTTETPEPANPPSTAGRYTYAYPTSQYGLHRARWTFDGVVPAQAYADAFNVAASDWAAFVSLAEVKAHLNIAPANTTHDDELRGFILSACVVVEGIVGHVARRTVTETYSGTGGATLRLRKVPALSIVEVVENGTTLTADDYSLSDAGLLYRRSGYSAMPWQAGLHNISIEYVVGRAAAGWSVLDGTKDLIRLNWRPQQGGNYSPWDQGGVPQTGGEVRLGFFIPNTVMQRLQPAALGPIVV